MAIDPSMANNLGASLEFTGERMIPGRVELGLEIEHVSRYAYAASLLKSGRVLDDGCGAGYGSELLTRAGAEVIGVDMALDVIQYCQRHYRHFGIKFFQTDCTQLPFPDELFDGVVSFEVIEHVKNYSGYLKETARVLRPGGVLIISTPNKRMYSDHRTYRNPYHVHEFYPDEFKELLSSYFDNVQLLGQSRMLAMFIGEFSPREDRLLSASWLMPSSETMLPVNLVEYEPVYMLAVCHKASQESFAEHYLPNHVFLTSEGNPLGDP